MDVGLKEYGDRLRVIEMVRHPLYLLEHWYHYVERYATDPREFTLWTCYKGNYVPWFANGWEDKYLNLGTMDKVIHSIAQLTELQDRKVASLPQEQRDQILFIPFERFVTDPLPYLSLMEKFLGVKRTAATKKTLKRQKCPRSLVGAGRGHKKYGFQAPSAIHTEQMELDKRWGFARKEASSEALELLNKLSSGYERKYDVVL